MLLYFKDTVERIASERGAYLSGDDKFKIKKLEDDSRDINDAIGKIKEIKEIRLKFKDSDYSAVKKRVSAT